MDLEHYNRSFKEHIDLLDEEADAKLRAFRRQCVRDFINRLNNQQREWNNFFREFLSESQEEVVPPSSDLPFFKLLDFEDEDDKEKSKNQDGIGATKVGTQALKLSSIDDNKKVEEQGPVKAELGAAKTPGVDEKQIKNEDDLDDDGLSNHTDTWPDELRDCFTNLVAVKEFVRIQEILERNRALFEDLNTNPSLKAFKNDINLFIRTQINSISNSGYHHLESKVKLLASLFSGYPVSYQQRSIDASKHPQGQLFAMDLAAQTFVTVGTRLVNSVPAIAKSMATVINGIVRANLPLFKDLVVGHLQERCAYLIPIYPRTKEFRTLPDWEVKYKIACGYTYDAKTKVLENEDKYLARMRSMALIYACTLTADEQNIGDAWSWLASFLSLTPRPVLTATILQAFLQETSKALAAKYGWQFEKLLAFIRTDYMKMIETATTQAYERQSLIKLQNLLSQ